MKPGSKKHKKKIRQIFWSAFVAVTTLIISYLAINIDFLGWEEKTGLTLSEWGINKLGWNKDKEDSEVIFIDVTYDKELRDISDEYKMPMGNTQITNRRKLFELLKALQKAGNYKFVLCDLLFPSNTIGDQDDSLFQLISEMDRIVIPRQEMEQPEYSGLKEKMGDAIYFTSVMESDFVKYPYLRKNSKSIPLIIYEEITGNKIEPFGFLYLEDGKPVRKSVFLTFDTRLRENTQKEEDFLKLSENLTIYLLGRDLLGFEGGYGLMEEIPSLIENKFVIIGSLYGDDTHSTYLGDMPGSLILYNAYDSLIKGRHLISPGLALILLLIYFTAAYMIINDFSLRKAFRQKLSVYLRDKKLRKSKKTTIFIILGSMNLVGWFSLSLILLSITLVCYFLMGEVYDIVLSGIYLIAVSSIIKTIPKTKQLIRILYAK